MPKLILESTNFKIEAQVTGQIAATIFRMLQPRDVVAEIRQMYESGSIKKVEAAKALRENEPELQLKAAVDIIDSWKQP